MDLSRVYKNGKKMKNLDWVFKMSIRGFHSSIQINHPCCLPISTNILPSALPSTLLQDWADEWSDFLRGLVFAFLQATFSPFFLGEFL